MMGVINRVNFREQWRLDVLHVGKLILQLLVASINEYFRV